MEIKVQGKLKLEDIVFWILISAIIAVALWLLSGSPPEANAIIAVALFVAASEILIWKNLFKIDKKTAIGFEKIKNNIDNKFSEIHNELNEIKLLIKK